MSVNYTEYLDAKIPCVAAVFALQLPCVSHAFGEGRYDWDIKQYMRNICRFFLVCEVFAFDTYKKHA